MARYFFTSESVTKGHPDKVCDQISDAILDAFLKDDEYSRVACETAITTDNVFILGEITSNSNVDIEKIVRNTIKNIGYSKEFMFDPDTCNVKVLVHKQSEDISNGVNCALETRGESSCSDIGAGDQGIIFGYACDETKEYMPLAISLAHKLTRKLEEVRENETINYLGPDGKSQVTVEYENDIPKRVDTIIISTQHLDSAENDIIQEDIKKHVIDEVIPKELIDENTKIYVNPSGRFVIGGPAGDSGLTGRKIIVDSYGGYAPHGGGAYSGKDPTKVDRSAAYMARFVCKNIVARKLAKKCFMQVAYAIGKANPVAININTYGTGTMTDSELEKYILENFDLKPGSIINNLNLRKPIYEKTASGGHFGKEGFSWEEIK